MDIYLIRHGQTEGNVNRMIIGRGPEPLNAEGKAQARRLARALKETKIDAFYVSPSMRAQQTAQYIMRERDSVPFVQEVDVDEIDFGSWVGMKIEEALDSEIVNIYFYDPENLEMPGESVLDVQKRATQAVNRILAQNNLERVAVVSHADVIKAILAHYLEMPLTKWQNFRIDNASLSILKFEEKRKPRAIVVNWHSETTLYSIPQRWYTHAVEDEDNGKVADKNIVGDK